MLRWLRPRPGRPFLAGAPMLVAHRGGAALAPENTLFAFRHAIDVWGADMLEMDVRRTADGEVVVIHDLTVDRTTNGSGTVRDMTMDEIRSLDAGYGFVDDEGRHPFRGRGIVVPTFEEVLVSCASVWFTVEVKDPAAAGPLADVIVRHGAEARVLIAADHERKRHGAMGYAGPWGASRRQILPFWLSHKLPGGGPYTPAADILQVPEWWRGHRIVTPRLVAQAHRRNLPVQVWTVDDVDTMHRLLHWGVDGIQTDRPDLLAEVLTERVGRPAPSGLAPGAA